MPTGKKVVDKTQQENLPTKSPRGVLIMMSILGLQAIGFLVGMELIRYRVSFFWAMPALIASGVSLWTIRRCWLKRLQLSGYARLRTFSFVIFFCFIFIYILYPTNNPNAFIEQAPLLFFGYYSATTILIPYSVKWMTSVWEDIARWNHLGGATVAKFFVKPHYFLSYSQPQLYFTESLVHKLQNKHIPIWFALQRLIPGSDWQIQINQALEDAKGLILVVSKASIASSYVEHEWRTMLQANKPIYLVHTEAVELPPELADYPAIDLRGHFDKGVNRLITCLEHQEGCQDRSPREGWFGLPTRAPLGVMAVSLGITSLILLNLLSTIIFLLLVGMQTLNEWELTNTLQQIYLILPFIALAVFGCWILSRYLRRKEHSNFYRALLMYTIAVHGFWGFIIISATPDHMEQSLVSLAEDMFRMSPIGWTGATLLLILGIVGFFFHEFHPDSLRWAITGQAPRFIRRQGGYRYSVGETAVVTYQLHYHPDEQHLANIVSSAMKQAEHVEADDALDVDYHIVLVSNLFPLEQLPEFIDVKSNQLILIFLNSMEIPPHYFHYLRYQYVDFRQRDRKTIKNMANNLRLTNASMNDTAQVTDTSMRRLVLPGGISFIVFLGVVEIALRAFSAVFHFILTPLQTVWLQESIPSIQGDLLFDNLLNLLLIGFLAWVLNKLQKRELTVLGMMILWFVIPFVASLMSLIVDSLDLELLTTSSRRGLFYSIIFIPLYLYALWDWLPHRSRIMVESQVQTSARLPLTQAMVEMMLIAGYILLGSLFGF